MKLYLVRHGQSYFNKEGILGGNPELTPRGIQEANKVASILKEIKLSKIYCSKLKRAVQTATIIHSYHPRIPLYLQLHYPLQSLSCTMCRVQAKRADTDNRMTLH